MTRLLRQANAVSKGAFAISLCAYVFLCPDWRILAVYMLGLLAVLALTGELDRTALLLLGVLVGGMPVLLVLFLLGGVEKAATWQEGVWLGLGWLGVFTMRLVVMVLVDLVVVKLTSFSNMILSLRGLRLPGVVVLFVSALVSMLPNICGMALRVIEVQRCRGFEAKKLLRPRSFLPLFIPVFLAQMRRSADLALSLELRGVSGESMAGQGRLSFCGGDLLFFLAAILVWVGPISWAAYTA
jgi:energy-coupling factor transport system permease protein